MRRPRDLWPPPDHHDGVCWVTKYQCGATVSLGAASPRQYRRVAAWLRRVADWYEWLAKKQEAKR